MGEEVVEGGEVGGVGGSEWWCVRTTINRFLVLLLFPHGGDSGGARDLRSDGGD